MNICAGFEALCELVVAHPQGTTLPQDFGSRKLMFDCHPLRVTRILRVPICRLRQWTSEVVLVLDLAAAPGAENCATSVLGSHEDIGEVRHVVLRRWATRAECRKWNPKMHPYQTPLMVVELLRLSRYIGEDSTLFFEHEHSTEFIVHY